MMWFDSWTSLGTVLLTGLVAYAALVLFLRVSGKRTLSKMNAFDFVVTVAMGSTLASTILSDTPVAEGVAALGLLIVLQYVITWASVRSEKVQGVIKSQPTIVYARGEFLAEAMMRERVTTEEVRNAAREQGIASLNGIAAVVLETDGSFTVLQEFASGEASSALANVGGAGDHVDTGEGAPPVARLQEEA
jgi:uncharacterized membrane protein YcaP (DUF421 family)